MVLKRRLLILGPSFRRNKSPDLLPALERYDGMFYRVARKYLATAKNIDILVMVDDLTLVKSKTPVQYSEPEGSEWGRQKLEVRTLNESRKKNEVFLTKKLKDRGYTEVFLSMGKQYAEALPDFSHFNVKLVFPATGGPGPKAQALKNWIAENLTTNR